MYVKKIYKRLIFLTYVFNKTNTNYIIKYLLLIMKIINRHNVFYSSIMTAKLIISNRMSKLLFIT